jgi:hypothetical protein
MQKFRGHSTSSKILLKTTVKSGNFVIGGQFRQGELKYLTQPGAFSISDMKLV